ncbi:MAG: hypothetical protein MHM6MM_000614 [Cercozoa sp. M6MM]
MTSWDDRKERFSRWWNEQKRQWLLAWQYVYADSKRRPRSTLIGASTVFFVVAFTALLQAAVSRAPLIYFRLAEKTVGELDILVTPGSSEFRNVDAQDTVRTLLSSVLLSNTTAVIAPLINDTQVDTDLARDILDVSGSESRIHGSFPRFVFPASINESKVTLLSLDQQKERTLGVGREFKTPALPLEIDGIWLQQSVAQRSDFELGGTANVSLNVLSLVDTKTLFNQKEIGDILTQQLVGDLDGVTNVSVPVDVDTNVTLNGNTTLPAQLRDVQVDSTPLNVTNITGTVTLGELFDQVLRNNNVTNDTSVVVPLNMSTTVNVTLENRQISQLLRNTVAPVLEVFLTNSADQLQNIPLQPQKVRGIFPGADGKWPSALGQTVVAHPEAVWAGINATVAPLVSRLLNAADLFNTTSLLNASNFSVSFVTNSGNITNIGDITNVSDIASVTVNNASFDQALLNSLNETLLGQNVSVRNDVVQALDNVKLEEFTPIQVVTWRQRATQYLKSTSNVLDQLAEVTALFVDSVDDLARAAVTVSLPLATQLVATDFVRLFLDNVFLSSVLLMLLLCTLLVMALMLTDAAAEQFQAALLRALGLPRKALAKVLLTKVAIFAVPALLFGLLVATLAFLAVSKVFDEFAALDKVVAGQPTPASTPPGSAILVASLMGVFIPLIAIVVPLRRALGDSARLRDALDIQKRAVDDVKIEQIDETKISFVRALVRPATLLSAVALLLGAAVFWLIPMSFALEDFALFLGILNFVLLAMIAGLVLLAQLLQPFVEIFLVSCLGWCRLVPPGDVLLIHKQQASHRPRNKQTALMFTTAVAFVVFASTMLALQKNNILDGVASFAGSDLSVLAIDPRNQPLPEADIRRVLAGYDNLQYTFISDTAANSLLSLFHENNNSTDLVVTESETRIGTASFFRSVRQNVYALEENYLDVAYDRYVRVASYATDESGQRDLVRELYRRQEETGITMPSYMVATGVSSDSETLEYPSEWAQRRQQRAQNVYSQPVAALVSQALDPATDLSTQTPFRLRLRNTGYDSSNSAASKNDEERDTFLVAQAHALVRKFPGFFLSRFAPFAWGAPMLVTQPTLDHMVRQVYADFTGEELAQTKISQRQLLVLFRDGTTKKQREAVAAAVQALLESSDSQQQSTGEEDPDSETSTTGSNSADFFVTVDVISTSESLSTAADMLDLFFLILGLLAMVLCFFLLLLSTIANVHEHRYELGVLRASGMTKRRLTSLFVIESLALTISSATLGTLVGAGVAMSLAAQFALFSEQPLAIVFPCTIGAMVSMSIWQHTVAYCRAPLVCAASHGTCRFCFRRLVADACFLVAAH